MSKPLPRRADLRLIVQLVPPGGRVLDVGCGDGTLLQTLETEKQVDGHGIEIRNHRVEACMRKGLSVIQGDADTDLPDFPDRSFDYVILSQALQNMHRPREVLDQLLRIGERVIVSFPNLGHWRARLTLLCRGRMPIVETSDTPRTWYDTPNIHLCTIRDFLLMCETLGITVEEGHAVGRDGSLRRLGEVAAWDTLWTHQAVYVLTRPRRSASGG